MNYYASFDICRNAIIPINVRKTVDTILNNIMNITMEEYPTPFRENNPIKLPSIVINPPGRNEKNPIKIALATIRIDSGKFTFM